MGIPVLVMGKSGSGKSASLRGFEPGEVGIINVLGKELPFKNKHKMVVSSNYEKIQDVLYKAKIDVIFIDDAGYLLTTEFMRRAKEKGYDKFTELAQNFYMLIEFIQHSLPEGKIVFLAMHEDERDSGSIHPKTIGRMLDEKVCVEGLFTIVLRATKIKNDYVFVTRTDGLDVTKTPMGMFENTHVPNDLKLVTNAIKKYYETGEETNEEN